MEDTKLEQLQNFIADKCWLFPLYIMDKFRSKIIRTIFLVVSPVWIIPMALVFGIPILLLIIINLSIEMINDDGR